MKRITVFLFYALTLLSYKSVATPFDSSKVLNAVFYITDGSSDSIRGQGFVIDKSGLAYTNVHCLKNISKAQVHFLNGKSYGVKLVLRKGEKNGLLEFKIDLPESDSLEYIQIADHAPYVDDESFAYGIYLENNRAKTINYEGLVSTVYMFDGVGEGILTTIPVFNDLDGAPMLNDKGEVVGVFSLPLSEKFKFNFALSIENFAKLKVVNQIVEIKPTLTHDELLNKYGKYYDSLVARERALQPVFDSIIDGWNMFVRIDALTDFIKAFKRTLEIPGSYLYPFDSLVSIEKLYAPDGAFRIFNWTLKFDAMSSSFDRIMYRYLGVIQFNTLDSLSYIPLFDGKNKIPFDMIEDTVLTNESWFGVQYYDIRLLEHKKKKYYLLLGWDGYDDVSDQKLIDVLWFDEDGSPRFGAPIFYIKKTDDDGNEYTQIKYRKVYQYNDIAIMSLKYMEEKNAIVFDHLVARDKKNANRPWLFVPDGTYNAFKIKKGKLIYTDFLYEKTRNYDKHSKK